jgi:hypothetical protein
MIGCNGLDSGFIAPKCRAIRTCSSVSSVLTNRARAGSTNFELFINVYPRLLPAPRRRVYEYLPRRGGGARVAAAGTRTEYAMMPLMEQSYCQRGDGPVSLRATASVETVP